MPSGAKRRKAAKKKKERLANNSNATQQGNEESKSHDEKDSDSGSVSSPTTSHEHENPLRKEDVEDEGKGFEGVGDLNRDGEELVETKEVDFETRVIDVEAFKEPNVDFESKRIDIEFETMKEKERLNRDSFGNTSNVEVEKKLEFEAPKKEELSESKDGVETPVIEPVGEVVSVSEVVVVNPVKEVVCQSEEATQPVEVNRAEKSGDSSPHLKDIEDKMVPQLNVRSVETSNGNGDPKESHVTVSSDNHQQKEVAAVPPTVRPTSWKSCCGLFDVLTGSDR